MSEGTKAVPKGNGKLNSHEAIYPGVVQNVTFNGTSAQSAAFGSSTKLVRVAATQACFLAFGANPTAAASSGILLPAGVSEKFIVNAGEKLAVVQSSSGGILGIVEVASV